MDKELSIHINDGKLVSIYCSNADDGFVVGFILAVSDGYVLIKEVDSYGKFDGYTLIRIEDIYQIHYSGKYEKKLEKLYDLEDYSNILSPGLLNPLVDSILHFAHDNHYIISVLSEGGDTISGFIDSFSAVSLTIDCIDEFGQKNGTTIIDRNCVSRICCLSAYENSLYSIIGET